MDNLNEEEKIASKSKNQSERTISGSSSLMIFYCWDLTTEEKIWLDANSKEIQVQASSQLFGVTHSPSH